MSSPLGNGADNIATGDGADIAGSVLAPETASTELKKTDGPLELDPYGELPSFIDPDHVRALFVVHLTSQPLMVRIQEKITKQLIEANDKLDVEIKEKVRA